MTILLWLLLLSRRTSPVAVSVDGVDCVLVLSTTGEPSAWAPAAFKAPVGVERDP